MIVHVTKYSILIQEVLDSSNDNQIITYITFCMLLSIQNIGTEKGMGWGIGRGVGHRACDGAYASPLWATFKNNI